MKLLGCTLLATALCALSCASIIGTDFGDYRVGSGGAAPVSSGDVRGGDSGVSQGGVGQGGRGSAGRGNGGTSGATAGAGGSGNTGGGGASHGGVTGSGGFPPLGDAGPIPPLDLYLVVDKSGSMNETVTGGTKWAVVTGALDTFLNDPKWADLGVGVEYFPLVNPDAPASCTTTADCVTAKGDFGTCTGTSIPFIGCLSCYCSLADACVTGSYVPVVPLSLPPNHATVVADLASRAPGGGTPTRPALEGALAYATSWAAQHQRRTTVVVLATDGDPTGCTTNAVTDVSNVAAAGLTQGVRTFVVGVGASLTSLDQVAAAGGTNQAYVLDTAGNVAQGMAQALTAIVTTARGP